MSLDRRLLAKVRELGNGVLQARCPACAEQGADTSGEHLRIFPDGRFGCCVHTNDREHRRRIFALVGERQPRAVAVKVARVDGDTVPTKPDLLGRLGRQFAGRNGENRNPDASDGVDEVQTRNAGTPMEESRTLRTGISKSCARPDEVSLDSYPPKDFGEGVRSVREREPSQPLPYLSPSGLLVIPFASDARYHWWKDGQDPDVTRAEVMERMLRADEGNKEADDAGI